MNSLYINEKIKDILQHQTQAVCRQNHVKCGYFFWKSKYRDISWLKWQIEQKEEDAGKSRINKTSKTN